MLISHHSFVFLIIKSNNINKCLGHLICCFLKYRLKLVDHWITAQRRRAGRMPQRSMQHSCYCLRAHPCSPPRAASTGVLTNSTCPTIIWVGTKTWSERHVTWPWHNVTWPWYLSSVIPEANRGQQVLSFDPLQSRILRARLCPWGSEWQPACFTQVSR